MYCQMCWLILQYKFSRDDPVIIPPESSRENEEEAEILNASYSGSYLAITIVTIQ